MSRAASNSISTPSAKRWVNSSPRGGWSKPRAAIFSRRRPACCSTQTTVATTESVRANPEFQAGYAGFERLNATLKQLITDWQTITVRGQRVPNDHSDKDYDARVIDRLGDFHERSEEPLEKLANALPRLTIYRDKLEAALDKAEKGAIAWVSDAKIESYHTVWYELHEDLLRLMQRERSE